MPKKDGVDAVHQRPPNLLILGVSGHVAQAFLRRLGGRPPVRAADAARQERARPQGPFPLNTAGSATGSSATGCGGRTTGPTIGSCCGVTRLTSCST